MGAEAARGLADIADAIGDPSRAAMLMSLMNSGRLAARDLADAAGVTASTATTHLAKLTRAQLVTVEHQGRLKWFRLATPQIAHVLEALANISPTSGIARKTPGSVEPDRAARMCYDHLAGRLGVELTDSLLRSRLLSDQAYARRPVRGTAYSTTKRGIEFLRSFGISPSEVRSRQRSYAHACVDRTERRPHVAGSLGAAIARRAFDLGWLVRVPGSRALRVTPVGRRGLKATFGILEP
jgi:DNA-binding transcriptional ArsR family regulator